MLCAFCVPKRLLAHSHVVAEAGRNLEFSKLVLHCFLQVYFWNMYF